MMQMGYQGGPYMRGDAMGQYQPQHRGGDPGVFGGMGGGGGGPSGGAVRPGGMGSMTGAPSGMDPMQQNSMQNSLAAYFASVGRGNNQAPFQMGQGGFQPGGFQPRPIPMSGGFGQPQSGGYDSSGINPGGMYTGGQQPPIALPQGGFQGMPLRNLGFGGR